VSSEIAGQLEQGAERRRSARKPARVIAVEAIAPLTVVAGIVWAIAQPYRIAFIYRDGKGLYDYLAQPPILVVLVGIVFGIIVAPGLVADIEEAFDEAFEEADDRATA
jgi:hypothetical protein